MSTPWWSVVALVCGTVAVVYDNIQAAGFLLVASVAGAVFNGLVNLTVVQKALKDPPENEPSDEDQVH